MEPYVNIVLSDRGWIIERLGKALAERLSYIKLSDTADASAMLNYYITYSAWKSKFSHLQVGFFTHIEKHPGAKKKFFDIASNMDYCICMSDIYRESLEEAGIKNVSVIKPGLDLDLFRPMLQIGVVGRTYDSGRKGEHLVEQLKGLDWIDWHFTGEGWPGPALKLSSVALPDFYRKMDYILVPALYEGGPMCIPEALACGTPVIAPHVGWASDFEHINYKTGDSEDLRHVLEKLYAEKKKRAEQTAHLTWDAWAEGHDRVFKKLAQSTGVPGFKSAPVIPAKEYSVAIIMHSNEKATLGGPSFRAPETAARLNSNTRYAAEVVTRTSALPSSTNLCHIFNLYDYGSCVARAESAARAGLPIILSPIFLDESVVPWYKGITRLFEEYYSDKDFVSRLAALNKRMLASLAKPESWKHPFFEAIQLILDQSERLIFLSENEKNLMLRFGFRFKADSLIHNPISSASFDNADPELFKQKFGVQDYVLCVGRLEARKNQLMLAYALKDLDIPVVFVGHDATGQYLPLLKKMAGRNAIFAGRLDAASSLLASAYAGCRVFCLPSFAEGASLANLEAAASGCNMVLSSRSSEREYFGDYARYCDPSDIEALRNKIMEAWDNPINKEQRASLKNYIKTKYSWDSYIAKTVAAYDQTLSHWHKAVPKENGGQTIYFDLTKNAFRRGPVTGMARVEYELAHAMWKKVGPMLRFIKWDRESRNFLPTDPGFIDLEIETDASAFVIEEGGIVIASGGAWLGNSLYLDDLLAFVRSGKRVFVPFIHDVIQAKFPYWFPAEVAFQFDDAVRKVLLESSKIFTDSQCSAKDISEYAAKNILPYTPPLPIQLGSQPTPKKEIKSLDTSMIFSLIGRRPFVLCVSSFDGRKNHAMLYSVWRSLCEEYGPDGIPHLLCVGTKQWNSEYFIDILKRDELACKCIHILHNIDDDLLDWLYRNCLFTVYPSQYEGWGLPVAESLAHGKICIASNAASIPEIAPGLTDLIDPRDYIEWRKQIKSYMFNSFKREAKESEISKYRIWTWQQAGEKLVEELQKNSPMPVKWQIAAPGKSYSISTNVADQRFLGIGWTRKEDSWIARNMAQILLRTRPDTNIVYLKLKLKTLVPADFKVLGNGVPLLELSVSQKELIELNVPVSCVSVSDLVDINIEIMASYPESDSDKETGFEIDSFRVCQPTQKDVFLESAVQKIDTVVGGVGPKLRILLEKRSDIISSMMKYSDYAHIWLLLWIWTNGIYEEEVLTDYKESIRMAITALDKPIGQDQARGCSNLIRCIWHLREDLQQAFPDENSLELNNWFLNNGIKEYNLEHFAGNS